MHAAAGDSSRNKLRLKIRSWSLNCRSMIFPDLVALHLPQVISPSLPVNILREKFNYLQFSLNEGNKAEITAGMIQCGVGTNSESDRNREGG